MKTKKKNLIHVAHGDITKIAAALKTSRITVRTALAGDDSSPLRKQIRYVALREFGGKYVR